MTGEFFLVYMGVGIAVVSYMLSGHMFAVNIVLDGFEKEADVSLSATSRTLLLCLAIAIVAIVWPLFVLNNMRR